MKIIIAYASLVISIFTGGLWALNDSFMHLETDRRSNRSNLLISGAFAVLAAACFLL